MTPYTSAANQWSPARRTTVLGLWWVEGTREVTCLPSLCLQALSTTAGIASQGQDAWAPVTALL